MRCRAARTWPSIVLKAIPSRPVSVRGSVSATVRADSPPVMRRAVRSIRASGRSPRRTAALPSSPTPAAVTTPIARLNHSSLDVAPSTVSRGSATTTDRPSGPVSATTRQSAPPPASGTVTGRPRSRAGPEADSGSRGLPVPLPSEWDRSRPSEA